MNEAEKMKDEVSDNRAKLLKEVAPYIDFLEMYYAMLVKVLLKDGKDLEHSEESAAFASVVGGLSLARESESISECPEDLEFLSKIFRILMSVKKSMASGMMKAHIEGYDQFGWPRIVIDDCSKLRELLMKADEE